jgi:hypothetical protein
MRNTILALVSQGWSYRRIHRELGVDRETVAKYALLADSEPANLPTGAYDAVKRFVRRLRAAEPTVYARIGVAPGEEAQVDFGSGVAAIVRLDNLKAGVTRACLYDPEINRLYADYAAHAGFTPLPCKPGRPEHKGKVERGIGYTKNALKGRTFGSLEEQNEFLRTWNRTVARVRIHGTTKQQVWARFVELEKPALKPLPAEGFSFCRFGTRKVHPDGHVEVDRAYYSVPHRYVGREVEVRWDERMVRIVVNHEIVAVHRKLAAPGRFTTRTEHLPARKTGTQAGYQAHLLARAERLGPGALGWALGALGNRGPLALRPIQGGLGLCRKYPPEEVN